MDRYAVRRRPLTLLAVVLAVALSAPPCGAVTAEGWTRLDTESFTFFSNAGEKVTRRYARELETFRDFVGRSLGVGAVDSPLPTHVYLFAGDFDEASLGPGNVGWFTSTRQANFIAVDTASRGGIEIAYHEYVHFVVENLTPAVPLWLNEGLAEFYSTFRAGRKGPEVGRPLDRHVEFLRRERLMPFDDLFAVTRDSADYTEERRRGGFYAQSWAFVHYLLVGLHDLDVEVQDFLDRLRDGESAETAYRAAFGTSTVGLRRDLEHYVGKAIFDFLRYPETAPEVERRDWSQPLDEAEATARLGLLLMATGNTAGDPRAYFERALELDPDNPTALRGRGQLALLRGDLQIAEAWLVEALQRRPGDAEILDLHGLALLQRAESDARNGAEPTANPEHRQRVARARQSFGRAITAAPDFAPALAGYGRTFFWEDDPSEGIEVSARAVRLLPRNAHFLSTHLALIAQAGDLERARRVHAWLQRPAVRADDQVLADADRALFHAGYRALVLRYDEPRDYPQLLTALESLLDRAPDARLADQVDRQIDELRAVVEHNLWADTFNRALDLFRQGDHVAARRLLRKVVSESGDPEIAAEAERTLAEAAVPRSNR